MVLLTLSNPHYPTDAMGTCAQVDWGAMAAFLDAPVAAERGGGVPSGPVSYGGTAPQEDEASEVRGQGRRLVNFWVTGTSSSTIVTQ